MNIIYIWIVKWNKSIIYWRKYRNIFYFAKILNNQTQLIIVSHRPGTMEKADILYGVTMQEKGITSIFNVNLDQIKEEFIN
ncbi:MAG: hypothetical protein HPPSJP_4360 [Candidatus Hepatoplasma scabrum]|nr:MAG: hypothetical protein HPPSJP_4360 [Candidatus Hepatoplasma sp.]